MLWKVQHKLRRKKYEFIRYFSRDSSGSCRGIISNISKGKKMEENVKKMEEEEKIRRIERMLEKGNYGEIGVGGLCDEKGDNHDR